MVDHAYNSHIPKACAEVRPELRPAWGGKDILGQPSTQPVLLCESWSQARKQTKENLKMIKK